MIERLNAALEGRYTIERELGEGGMAAVCLADDLKHDLKVAIKVLKPELATVVGAERFLAEIRTTANLQHPQPWTTRHRSHPSSTSSVRTRGETPGEHGVIMITFRT